MIHKIILASASPRRKEILEKQGIIFEVKAGIKDEITAAESPEEIVMDLSYGKASEVYENEDGLEDILIIGADTIVVCQREIMGKPVDDEDAFRMLFQLQGKTHQVYTGVTLILRQDETETIYRLYEVTDVTMHPMNSKQIWDYIRTKEPEDKAGAYAIQGKCGIYIKGISGDYNNVVGLPIARIYQELIKMNIDITRVNKKDSCSEQDADRSINESSNI